MADFKINDEVFQDLIAQQVLASMSEQSKENLVKEALSFLMRKQQSLYSSKVEPSPLALAFQNELLEVAKSIAKEILEEPSVSKEIQDSIRTAVLDVIGSHSYSVASIVGNAIRDQLEIQMRE